ncbi:hypothetical protein G647_01164 [Cladophialophora carrionii CBS 160.54]|uniref:Uncharacterized protein n=1 Tax=Cladophialophora carrionii CBS 160.54 TaxID=1279043 RepID=V9DQX3_9EURO|nr:uncharacterized protein G647_01164 [Cladophialophora carrionii CBS 160.54]ETI28713.1 hypothetical protein G647_01164 [Cladophialophora carrionii CBS 160.54]
MAAPPEITCTNLSGKFVMNKSLSDDTDPMFALQGLSWLTRTAIRLATVVLTIKEYKQDDIYHVDITSVASGLSTTQENRTLDWKEREHADRIFGNCRGKSRLWKTGEFKMEGPGSEEDAAFLQAHKLKDGQTDSKFLDDEHVQSLVKNVDDAGGWQAEMVWGFEEINGERRYTRRIVVWKNAEFQRVRLVYDYKGPAEKKDNDEADLAYGDE